MNCEEQLMPCWVHAPLRTRQRRQHSTVSPQAPLVDACRTAAPLLHFQKRGAHTPPPRLKMLAQFASPATEGLAPQMPEAERINDRPHSRRSRLSACHASPSRSVARSRRASSLLFVRITPSPLTQFQAGRSAGLHTSIGVNDDQNAKPGSPSQFDENGLVHG